MAARREYGAPSALTVLEVAEGLRWTDPALGASLAEHARRLAGDDPTVRAAADRSVIRSLEESDRHEDVVARGVPLLAEARERGDRDDGAAVLVELAAAATGLGDAGIARRLLDRLGPVAELPARIGAVACAARAESCAAEGDVSGTDAAGDAATPVLFRVPQPDSTVVRARIALARGIARRRAGDGDGALAAFGPAISADPSGDVDGSRYSLLAVAEQTELLVEQGRHDEARARGRDLLPEGTPGAHVATAVARIRLALASTSAQGTTTATAVAEELESAGRGAEAARAWERVAEVAEQEGDLGRALAALRRGHGLSSRTRDTSDRALRMLASVAEGSDVLVAAAAPDPGTPPRESGTGPTRRRERHSGGDAVDVAPAVPAMPEPAGVTDVPMETTAPPTPPQTAAPLDPGATWSAPAPAEANDTPESGVAGGVRPESSDPVPAAAPRSTRDELAELLASLTRSVDSSRAAASAMGLEPASAAASDAEPVERAERVADEPEAERRSRHSAFPAPAAQPAVEPSATRPTFDAFSTAPFQRVVDDGTSRVTPPVAPLPDDRFAPAGDGSGREVARTEEPRSELDAVSVSDLADPLATGSGATAPDDRVRDGASSIGHDARWDLGAASVPVSSTETDVRSGRDSTAPSTSAGSTAGGAGPAREAPARSGPDGLDADRAPGTRSGSETPDTAPPVTDRRGADARGADARGADARGAADRSAEIARTRGATGEERVGPSSAGRSGTWTSARADDETTGAPTTRTSTSGGRPTPDHRDAPAPGPGAGPRAVDEYEQELALTLATVLGEYHLPDVAMPARQDRDRDRDRGSAPVDPPSGTPKAADVAVPSARRHTSGSMPVPADQRWTPRAEETARPARGEPSDERRSPTPNGRGRPPESGARLADLLAEAMDAFRHVGPEVQDGARGPGVGSRRA